MAIIIDSFEQRSPQWFEARLGSPGASSISNIITTSGELSKSREGYLYQLAAEKVSGKCDERFMSKDMQNGTDREDASRSLFEMIYDVDVRQVGIVYKDERKLYHVSPDGLIGDNSILEMKNPIGKTAVKYLLKKKVPSEYFAQCQMSLYVAERQLLYFMSAYDGLPPLIIEVHRDEAFIKKLAQALDDFCEELASVVEKLRRTPYYRTRFREDKKRNENG